MQNSIRIALVIEYDGTHFYGWQIQPNVPTVQEELENALQTVFRQHIRVHGSGRTDTGVHSSAQVAHCNIPRAVDYEKLIYSLNSMTPHSIVIHDIKETAPDFHARFDAISRRYKYYISPRMQAIHRNSVWTVKRELNLDYMNKIAQYLLGEHDFMSFSKLGSDVEDYRSIIYECRWKREESLYVFEVSAIRFLRGMVRGLVGTFVEYEKTQRPLNDWIWLMDQKDRKKAPQNAPAHGLNLEEVCYDQQRLRTKT